MSSRSGFEFPAPLSRRTFVKGLALSGAAASLGLWTNNAWARSAVQPPATLSGTEFDLAIAETPMNVTGTPRVAVMTVVAADGQYVHPVSVDEFRIAVAETFDVIVEPAGQEACTIFAQSMDLILGTAVALELTHSARPSDRIRILQEGTTRAADPDLLPLREARMEFARLQP